MYCFIIHKHIIITLIKHPKKNVRKANLVENMQWFLDFFLIRLNSLFFKILLLF